MEQVLLAICDVHGALRGKLMSARSFERACARGLPMTDLVLALDPLDVPIDTFRTIGIHAGARDLRLWPVEATLRPLEWRPGTWICLSRATWGDGTPCELASRETAERSLEQLAGRGYEAMSAFEYAIRVRATDGSWATNGLSYSLEQVGRLSDLGDRLWEALGELGIELSAIHTEAGPGLLELNVAPRQGVRAADEAALLRFAVRDLAATLGLRATFMAKVASGEEGSSGHVHLSLWREDENVFALAPTSDELPAALRSALGGVLGHLPALSALLNPTVNSYKRLVPGFFAPINATWGFDNRSTAVRVIRATDPQQCRLECRRPGADANPYLVLAGLVAAIVTGLERGECPPPPIVGDAYELASPLLPRSLEEALQAFRADDELRKQLGDDFCDYYETTRAWELDAFQQAVTTWEVALYEGVC